MMVYHTAMCLQSLSAAWHDPLKTPEFCKSLQLACPHCCLSFTDVTCQIFQNSMKSVYLSMPDGFTLEDKGSNQIRWTFHWVSGKMIMSIRFSWWIFIYSVSSMSTSLRLVLYVIFLMTIRIVWATLGIVLTRIGSRADFSAECPRGGAIRTSKRCLGTGFSFIIGYNSHSVLIILCYLYCSRFTHSSRVFPHMIDSSNPTTSFSVCNLDLIATATEVVLSPTPSLSSTSAQGISESQTHLHTMNLIDQTWCSRIIVPDRLRIAYFLPRTCLACHWRIRLVFLILTASSSHSFSNSFFINWEQRSIMNCHYLHWWLPQHSPPAPGTPLHNCLYTVHPQLSLSVVPM